MARIRTIKPTLWTSPEFVGLSPFARLLWIGTWNQADDYGVLKDDPAELKLQILPGDNVDTYDLVDELVSRKMLLRKVAPDGTQVLVIRTFCMHQKIDTRSPGRWGHPDEFADNNRTLQAVDQRKCTHPNQSQPIPTDPTPVKERKGPSLMVNPDGSTDPYGDSFDEVWSHYPRKVNRKEALRAYQARRRSGVSHEQLLQATKHYETAMQDQDVSFVMHGKRFYGPNECWVEFVNPVKAVQTEQRVVQR